MTIHQSLTTKDRAPVALLHASASSSKQWNSLINELSERHEVFAPSLPGYAHDAPKRLGEVDGMASSAIPMIAQLFDLIEPMHLVGHSFGGGVALKIALMRPDLVKSLTLYEPAAFSLLRRGKRTDRALFERFCEVGRTLAIASRIGQPGSGLKGVIDFWNGTGAWEKMASHVQDRVCDAARVVSGDFADVHAEKWHALDQIAIPTCIMTGLDSPALAHRTAVELSSIIDGASLSLLPSAGHMGPLTHPELVNARVCDHIARIERSSAPCVWPESKAA